MSSIDDKYKYYLALDMIFVLMRALLYHKSNKIEQISQIIDSWRKKRSSDLKKANTSKAKQISEVTGLENEITSIVMSVDQVYNITVQKEFAEEIKQILISRFLKLEKNGPVA